MEIVYIQSFEIILFIIILLVTIISCHSLYRLIFTVYYYQMCNLESKSYRLEISVALSERLRGMQTGRLLSQFPILLTVKYRVVAMIECKYKHNTELHFTSTLQLITFLSVVVVFRVGLRNRVTKVCCFVC